MRNRGLTLIQMLISIVIVTLITAILLPVFSGPTTPEPKDYQAAYGTMATAFDNGSMTSDLPAGTVYVSPVVRK